MSLNHEKQIQLYVKSTGLWKETMFCDHDDCVK